MNEIIKESTIQANSELLQAQQSGVYTQVVHKYTKESYLNCKLSINTLASEQREKKKINNSYGTYIGKQKVRAMEFVLEEVKGKEPDLDAYMKRWAAQKNGTTSTNIANIINAHREQFTENLLTLSTSEEEDA